MKFLLNLLILSIAITRRNCLNSDDVCLSSKELECINNIDSNHKCGPSYCAKDKNVCERLLNLRYIARINNLKSMDSQAIKYIKFLASVKVCKNTKKLTNKTFEICLNGMGCSSKKRLFMFKKRIYVSFIIKPIDCPCRDDYGFQCGKEYCSKQESECNEFLKDMNGTIIEQMRNGLKKCGNDRYVVKENSSSFIIRY